MPLMNFFLTIRINLFTFSRIEYTVFPHIRPAGINFLLDLQVRVLLEITKFHLHKSVPTAGIIRVAGIIRGRALYEEIRYVTSNAYLGLACFFPLCFFS